MAETPLSTPRDSDSNGSIENIQLKHLEFSSQLKRQQTSFLSQEHELNEKLQYLLKHAEIYTNFLFQGEKTQVARRAAPKTHKRGVKADQDEELLHENQRLVRLTFQPSLIQNGKLRDYQLDGVNWMINLFKAKINGILADEMGLGKTIQTISFLAYLKEAENINGPTLIVCPKTMVNNWNNEFQKWCPCFRVVMLIAAKPYRDEIIKNELIEGQFDVCVTSYEAIDLCKGPLRKFRWKYLIIDEAQKIKNDESNISILVRKLRSDNRLLLTGTPLQNNLHELWSLLNFILPELFNSSEDFDEWFKLGSVQQGMSEEQIENQTVRMVQLLHRILKPFILRRTKSEVERGIPPKHEILVTVGMTQMQRELYKKILTNELIRTDNKSHYLNIVMQLRKVCNHPYLFPSMEENYPEGNEEHLVWNAGKMKVMDKLLFRLKQQNSQVLIFSQMTTMLDILEDYCTYRNYKFCRLDGATDIYERENMIQKFTGPNSKYFIFLLSTRAGGLGINLTTADTVILYDSDWNPQIDLQAMDRAHRIGQTKIVNVYRMITKDSLEERIIERQCLRLKLDSLIIQQGRLAPKHKPLEKQELQEMLHYGADAIFNLNEHDQDITEEELDLILQRGEDRYQQINQELEQQLINKKMNLTEFDSKLDMWNFESVDYSQRRKEESRDVILKALEMKEFEQSNIRRERNLKKSYNVDARLCINPVLPTKPKEFKPAPDFRFHDNRERLIELQKKDFDQEEMTQDEKDELQYLLSTGFDWSRKEYQSFLKALELYQQNEFEQMSTLVGRSVEEIENYSQVFWSRIDELQDKQRILKNIERRDILAEKYRKSQAVLDRKYNQYKNPRKELNFTSTSSHKSKIFTLDNDKYLVCLAKEVGYGNWETLKVAIRKSQYFAFDYMLRSRTAGELQRRIDSLIRIIEKEEEEKKAMVQQVGFKRKRNFSTSEPATKAIKLDS